MPFGRNGSFNETGSNESREGRARPAAESGAAGFDEGFCEVYDQFRGPIIKHSRSKPFTGGKAIINYINHRLGMVPPINGEIEDGLLSFYHVLLTFQKKNIYIYIYPYIISMEVCSWENQQ